MYTPQILLLGNGINRCFAGESWDNLLNDLDKKQAEKQPAEKANKSSLPMPLRAILATDNDIKGTIAEKKDNLPSKVSDDEQRSILQQLLSIRFDEILTTNYSYELEISSTQKETISDYILKKNMKTTQGRPESKFLLHTYQSVPFDGYENRVWHIHGECRKPGSMILGHYWYGGLLGKIISYSDQRRADYQFTQKSGQAPSLDSWIDAFILGDVYVLGFGFDISEFDLWWLLNRKYRENAKIGKVYFYEPSNEKCRDKIELMKLFGTKNLDFGITENELGGKFLPFYQKAIADIEEKVRAVRI